MKTGVKRPIMRVGTRTFSYNAALQLASEAIDGSSGGLYSKIITRAYQNGTGVPGRGSARNIAHISWWFSLGLGIGKHAGDKPPEEAGMLTSGTSSCVRGRSIGSRPRPCTRS